MVWSMRDRKRDTRGNGVSAERNQVSRDRGFSGKQFTSLWCTAISEFHVGRHQISESGNKLFGSIVAPRALLPSFSSNGTGPTSRYIAEKILKRPGRIYTILLITSGFFNWIWSTAIPLSHPLDRKPTICTDLCRLLPLRLSVHLWKILERVQENE